MNMASEPVIEQWWWLLFPRLIQGSGGNMVEHMVSEGSHLSWLLFVSEVIAIMSVYIHHLSPHCR